MGLRQTIAQWVDNVRDALDFGTEFPTTVEDHRATFVEELNKLQELLHEAHQAAREKDELIAQLQETGATRGDMIIDRHAYYVQRGSVLEGPFCLSCFEQKHQMARLVPAPIPEGEEGTAEEWIQCGQCRTPFRSERIGEYLHPRKTAVTPREAAPRTPEQTKPARPARKPRSQAHPAQEERPGQTKTPRRRKPTP